MIHIPTKWRFASLIGFVLLVHPFIAASQARDGGAASPSPGQITLVVTVLDSASKPVTGASVRVTPMGGNLQSETTGRDGTAQLKVPKGTLRILEVTASGYQAVTMTNVQATTAPATSVRVSLKALVKMVVVPDVVGKRSDDALNIVKGKGLVCNLFMNVGDAATAAQRKLPIIVQSQRPAAGTLVAPGTAVYLTCVPQLPQPVPQPRSVSPKLK